MFIQATAKLQRRTLNLESIKAQLTAGRKFPISEDNFYNSDIQTALSMGLIEAIGEPKVKQELDDESDEESSNMVKCKNIHKRPLTFRHINREIKPGETFPLKEADLQNPDIKNALSKGLIEVVNVGDDYDYKVATVKIKNLLKSEKKEASPEVKSYKEKREAKKLETNEEMKSPTKVIDTENPDPIRSEDQPDSNRAGVVTWNPTGQNPIISPRGNRLSDFVKEALEETKVAVANVIDDPNPPTIYPEKGNKMTVAAGKKMSDEEVNDILFVDQEQDKEDREKHPILSQTTPPESNDLEFV